MKQGNEEERLLYIYNTHRYFWHFPLPHQDFKVPYQYTFGCSLLFNVLYCPALYPSYLPLPPYSSSLILRCTVSKPRNQSPWAFKENVLTDTTTVPNTKALLTKSLPVAIVIRIVNFSSFHFILISHWCFVSSLTPCYYPPAYSTTTFLTTYGRNVY